jgi:hypothetical protein
VNRPEAYKTGKACEQYPPRKEIHEGGEKAAVEKLKAEVEEQVEQLGKREARCRATEAKEEAQKRIDERQAAKEKELDAREANIKNFKSTI